MDEDVKEYYESKVAQIESMKCFKQASETLLDSIYSLYLKCIKAKRENKKIDK